MLPESSRMNMRLGITEDVPEDKGTFEMSVVAANAGWATMQASVA
jgi:hypothetical protein